MDKLMNENELIHPEMIEVRRKMLGLSQKELASRVSITQGALSKIEQGLKPVTDEQIELFSSALECPKSLFFQKSRLYGGPLSATPMFKKKASIGVKVLDKLVAEINIRIIHLRKLLEFIDFEPEYIFPYYDLDDFDGNVEEIAKNVRKAWHLPSGTIKNVISVLERAGCIVMDCDMEHTGLSGVSYYISGLPPLIFINKNQSQDNYRFTLAHELGHLVMHRIPTPTMEEEADRFAAEFLMPASDIKSDLKEMTIEKAAYLKPFWRASMQSLICRAKTLKVITAGQENYLNRQMSLRGYRINEPVEIEILGERPTLINAILNYMRNELNYDLDDIAKIFFLSSKEVEQLYNLKPSMPTFRIVQ